MDYHLFVKHFDYNYLKVLFEILKIIYFSSKLNFYYLDLIYFKFNFNFEYRLSLIQLFKELDYKMFLNLVYKYLLERSHLKHILHC
jgi:hypothetical protein